MNEAVLYENGPHYATYEGTFVCVAVLCPSPKNNNSKNSSFRMLSCIAVRLNLRFSLARTICES